MDLKTVFWGGDLRRVNLLLLITINTAAIFFLDLFTPIEWAMWLFYTIPLLLVSRLFKARGIYIFAGICTALILADYLLPPSPVSPVNTEITLFNSAMGVGVLWVVAYLLARYKKTDEARREMDEIFRAMVEDSRVAAFLVQDDRFVYSNPRLRELYGYSERELKGIGFLGLISPDDQPALREMMSKLAERELKKIAVEVEGIKQNGEPVTIEIIGSQAVFNNKPALMGSMIDMSWKKLSSALFKTT